MAMLSLLRAARSLRPSVSAATRLRQPKMSDNFFRSSVSDTGLTRLLASNFFGASNPAAILRHGAPLVSKSAVRSQSTAAFLQDHFSQFTRTGKTNMMIIYGLIGINCAVYFGWQYAENAVRQGHRKPYVDMVNNATLSLHGVLQGRYWTILTSTFSQIGLMHLAGNMMSLYFMGGMLARTPGFGPRQLLTLTLGSAVLGSVGHLTQCFLNYRRTGTYEPRPALGFSGAAMGIGTVAAFLYPTQRFLLMGIIPMPLWGLMAGYFVYDGYYLNSGKTGTCHVGHLGGVAFGALYYFLALRRGPLAGLRGLGKLRR